MKRVVALSILGATALCVVISVSVPLQGKPLKAEEVKVTEDAATEPQFEYEQIEYNWGIIFREVHTGEEIVFTYDEPLEEEEEPESTEPEVIHITDPDNYYYITEVPLNEDPKKRSTREICEEIAPVYGFTPELLEAMCVVESYCDPTAFNGVDRGIIQVSKRWHSDRMQRLGVTNLEDPYGCILVAADFLAELRDTTESGNDIAYVLMRYNMTIDSAEYWYSRGVISEYATEVLRRANELESEHGK